MNTEEEAKLQFVFHSQATVNDLKNSGCNLAAEDITCDFTNNSHLIITRGVFTYLIPWHNIAFIRIKQR